MCVALSHSAQVVVDQLEKVARTELAGHLEDLLKVWPPLGSRRLSDDSPLLAKFLPDGHLVSFIRMDAEQLRTYNRQEEKDCKEGVIIEVIVNPFNFRGSPPLLDP